jgi:hypothetical protein
MAPSSEHSLVKRSAKEKSPPYARYAFLNPYNLSLIAGASAAAAATGHWWLALGAAAGEAIWMLFAPDSKILQRTWWNKLWEGEKQAERKKRQAQKWSALPDAERERTWKLREVQMRIEKMAQENPTMSVELLSGELGKMEDLVDDFLDLATVCTRYDKYLATFNLEEIEADVRRYELQVEKLPAGDERRTVAQKNLQVLLSRKDRYKELRRSLQTARGQMDLMENTFRLLADEVVGMHEPAELGARLDDLRDGVNAVREAARETERTFASIAQSETR